MTGRRGIFIVFEGCDRSGKTTQCKNIVQSLNQLNIPAGHLSFPDRTTSIGKILDGYLRNKEHLSDNAIHLMFSANRWELEPHIINTIDSGTSLIVDRYSYSGVAFSAAKKGMDLEWCLKPEVGLPKPDLVFFLNLSPEALEKRGGFGDERYENTEFQQKVLKIYNSLQDPSWVIVDADKDPEVLHQELLEAVLKKLKENTDKQLQKLW